MSKLDDLVPLALAASGAWSAGPDPSQLAANRSQFYCDLPGYLPQNRELAGHPAHTH